MIIVLKPGSIEADIEDVSRRVGEVEFACVEAHNNPAEALSDGPRSLKPDRFAALMAELRPLAQFLGRSL
jgi:3-deoxy-D-arabino-heptulosonate 7-phosphate (DAHP) synthase